MNTEKESRKAVCAIEISAALADRQIGLCGFDAGEAHTISGILYAVGSLAMVFDERLINKFSRVCDAIFIKLANISSEGLRMAAASSAQILVSSPSEVLLQGVGAAHCWPRDFIGEPWSDAELLLRLFRLLEARGGSAASVSEARSEPLVLLADDDPDLAALVEATLKNAAIVCETARDGLAALRMARELVPDLVVLDVKMPRMDGFEVLTAIRRDPSIQRLPVILLTGCDDPADIMRGSELHADEYIGKPVSPNLLLNRIRRLLSSQAASTRRSVRSAPGGSGARARAQKWGSSDSDAEALEYS